MNFSTPQLKSMIVFGNDKPLCRIPAGIQHLIFTGDREVFADMQEIRRITITPDVTNSVSILQDASLIDLRMLDYFADEEVEADSLSRVRILQTLPHHAHDLSDQMQELRLLNIFECSDPMAFRAGFKVFHNEDAPPVLGG